MSEELYDVIIIGAGPAGSTAAIILAKNGHRVALVDNATLPRDTTASAWISVKAEATLTELEVDPGPLLTCPFADVTLFSADLLKQSKPRFDGVAGYLLDRALLVSALTQTAVEKGVTLHAATKVTDLRLNESCVELTLADKKKLVGKLLLLASGGGSELLERAGFPRYPGGSPIFTAQVEAPIKASVQQAEPRVAIILGLDGGGSFALCYTSPDKAVVSVHWRGEPKEVIARLINLCRNALENGLIPTDLSKQVASASTVRSPAAAALDMDTHVSKHTLLIGDAGGFISAASNEGIYPAMWSAKLAARAVDAALGKDYTQDELMTFDSLWRMEMADHLRSPHTDIRFLLPLIFSNQPMADRMGAAFFFGQNI